MKPLQKEIAMLVFKRNSGQSFMVGEASITLHLEKKQIKVIIEAPKDIQIKRSELIEPSDNKQDEKIE
jgi:sRNA-binding carbon storage regulator CsrA